MCFSSPSMPSTPAPAPIAERNSAAEAAMAREAAARKLRGKASTILTSTNGVSGMAPATPNQPKTLLGA